jgi:hypothetical protein
VPGDRASTGHHGNLRQTGGWELVARGVWGVAAAVACGVLLAGCGRAQATAARAAFTVTPADRGGTVGIIQGQTLALDAGRVPAATRAAWEAAGFRASWLQSGTPPAAALTVEGTDHLLVPVDRGSAADGTAVIVLRAVAGAGVADVVVVPKGCPACVKAPLLQVRVRLWPS